MYGGAVLRTELQGLTHAGQCPATKPHPHPGIIIMLKHKEVERPSVRRGSGGEVRVGGWGIGRVVEVPSGEKPDPILGTERLGCLEGSQSKMKLRGDAGKGHDSF